MTEKTSALAEHYLKIDGRTNEPMKCHGLNSAHFFSFPNEFIGLVCLTAVEIMCHIIVLTSLSTAARWVNSGSCVPPSGIS